MARTVIVEGYGCFVGKRSERLLLRRPKRDRWLPTSTVDLDEPMPPGWGGDGLPTKSSGASNDGAPSRTASEGAGGELEVRASLGVVEGAAVVSGDAAEREKGRRGRATKAPREMEEEEIPLHEVGEIVLPARGVTVSVELLSEAASRGIALSFLSFGREPWGLLSSPSMTATVRTRREQLRAYDTARGAELCRKIVAGKLRNQAGLLGTSAKSARDVRVVQQVEEAMKSLRAARAQAMKVKGQDVESVRPSLLGIEGAGAKSYWDAFAALCGPGTCFRGRMHEGEIDGINAMLNYGYAILYARVWAAVLRAGLDPFGGFVHSDRPGRPSLVLDLVEELRAPVVDRAVLAHVRLGKEVGTLEGEHRLDEPTRKAVATAVLERLDAPVRYRNEKTALSNVVQAQARSLATWLRGEGEWRPFAMYW